MRKIHSSVSLKYLAFTFNVANVFISKEEERRSVSDLFGLAEELTNICS